MAVYKKRTLEVFFQKANKQFPVILVTGPRQVGKTTFLKHMAGKNRVYVTLDDPLVRNLAQDDPALFFQRFPPPVLIDEIQYAPQLLAHIKMAVDGNRQPGLFWLTGSQQFHLMNQISESLAGRIGILNLLGYSHREVNDYPVSDPYLPTNKTNHQKPITYSLTDLYQRIWRGSFPELYQSTHPDWQLFYGSYLQTYIQRDVRDLAHVGNEKAFLGFVRACAARTGQLLNIQNLCQDISISQMTGKKWLSILETCRLIYLLEPFSSNINKRLVKTPKLYFLDTGLAAYLTGWTDPAVLEAGAMSGAIFETWVIGEIIKSYWHNGKEAPLYFYRDKDTKEIDLLIYKDGTLYPVEIKKTGAPTRDAVRHFKTLNTLKKKTGPGALICLGKDSLPISENIQAVPAAWV